MKQNFRYTLLLFSLLLFQSGSFARGGGGGHSSGGYHGGGHSYSRGARGNHNTGGNTNGYTDLYAFFVIIGGIAVVLVGAQIGHKLLLPSRTARAKKQIQESAGKDQLWNPEHLEAFVHDVFMRVQRAWMNQDMQPLRDILTPALVAEYQLVLNRQKNSGVYNLLENVVIKKIRIIAAKDVRYNNADTFTAYIQGTITDELRRINAGTLVSEGKSSFEDLYYFIRKDNRWLLSSIDNKVSFMDVANAKTEQEA